LAIFKYYETNPKNLPFSPKYPNRQNDDIVDIVDIADIADIDLSIYRYRRAKPRRTTVMVSEAEPLPPTTAIPNLP